MGDDDDPLSVQETCGEQIKKSHGEMQQGHDGQSPKSEPGYGKQGESSYKPHKCLTCGHRFRMVSSLRSHYETDHSGLLPYLCDLCPKSFIGLPGLESHKSQIHDRVYRYQCGICKEKFIKKQGAAKHVIRHIDKPSYRCTGCLMEFQCQATGMNHVAKIHGRGNATIKWEGRDSKEHTEALEKYVIEIDPESAGEARKQTRPLQKIDLVG